MEIKHTENIPQLLHELKCSLAITTYQANNLMVINSPNGESLLNSFIEFEKPMGITFNDDDFAIATKNTVESYKKILGMNSGINYYHKLTYHTGNLDIHDLYILDNKIWFVNTKFSCLSALDEQYNFNIEWKPYFIKELKPNDHCHINGLAIDNNTPKYITALGDKDIPFSWHETILNGGILMDVQNNEIILKNLPMPHSPRIYSNKLYMLLSAKGEIIEVDTIHQQYNIIHRTDCFIRGLDLYNDYIFVGVSRQRKEDSVFKHLTIAENTSLCGIKIISLKTGNLIGEIEFNDEIDELFDVRIVPTSSKINFIESSDTNFLIQDTNSAYYKNIKNKYYD